MTEVYWFEQTEADTPSTNDWLTASELATLNSLRFAKRRADWRLGRWTAKRAVARYFKLPDEARALSGLEIRAAGDGAPEVFFEGQPAGVAISISHRDGRAVCVVAPQGTELGCDLEVIEPRSDAFIADYFTAEEQALVARAPASLRPRMVTLVWSAKESALKALRQGLRLDTRCLTVNPHQAQAGVLWNALKCHLDGQLFTGWWSTDEKFVRTLVALYCWPCASPSCCPPHFLL